MHGRAKENIGQAGCPPPARPFLHHDLDLDFQSGESFELISQMECVAKELRVKVEWANDEKEST